LKQPTQYRILLTGPTGQVGFELLGRLSSLGEVVPLSRSQLDLAEPEAVRRAIRDIRPNIIVNAAAYTAVDRAEAEPDVAMQVNGVAPGILAEEASHLRALLVHYSTDYVFDGSKQSPYDEQDPTRPLNQYGKSKLAGEHNVARMGGAYFTLRTSWVYSHRGSNFLLKMLQLGCEREVIRVVSDQIGSPTPASVVADATMAVLARCSGFEAAQHVSGIYHATCDGQTSWFEFASAIFARAQENGLVRLKVKEVLPVSTDEFPSPCRRPSYSVLSCKKIGQAFALRIPDWRDELNKIMRLIAARETEAGAIR
jgi:dTDP-4-dehydrorhamnose reductase